MSRPSQYIWRRPSTVAVLALSIVVHVIVGVLAERLAGRRLAEDAVPVEFVVGELRLAPAGLGDGQIDEGLKAGSGIASGARSKGVPRRGAVVEEVGGGIAAGPPATVAPSESATGDVEGWTPRLPIRGPAVPKPTMSSLLRALEGEPSWVMALRAAGAGSAPRLSEESLRIANPLVARVTQAWREALTSGLPILSPRGSSTREFLAGGAAAWRAEHEEFVGRQARLAPSRSIDAVTARATSQGEREVTVHVDVSPDDASTSARVVSSSGDETLDELALTIVQRAGASDLSGDGRRVSSIVLRLRVLRTGRWAGCGGVQEGRDDSRSPSTRDDAKSIACGFAFDGSAPTADVAEFDSRVFVDSVEFFDG